MPLLDKHKQKKQMSYLGKLISKAHNQALGKKKPAAKPAKKPAPKPKVTYQSTPKPTAPKNNIKPATVSTKPSPKRMSLPKAPKNQGVARNMALNMRPYGPPKPPTAAQKEALAAKKKRTKEKSEDKRRGRAGISAMMDEYRPSPKAKKTAKKMAKKTAKKMAKKTARRG